MAYRSSGYRRGYARPATAGPVDRVNQRAGNCRTCGVNVPAGVGLLYRETSGAWSVRHAPARWAGSPVSGKWAGGCPGEADRMNTRETPEEKAEQDAREAAAIAAHRVRVASRKTYAQLSSGVVVQASCSRCEDAPCCGCCD